MKSMIRFMYRDTLYRFRCAFSTDKDRQESSAAAWFAAFESFRQSFPTAWAVTRSWRVYAVAFWARVIATMLWPVWKIRGWSPLNPWASNQAVPKGWDHV